MVSFDPEPYKYGSYKTIVIINYNIIGLPFEEITVENRPNLFKNLSNLTVLSAHYSSNSAETHSPSPPSSQIHILQVLIVFILESLELDFALLFLERHILLRVLPVSVVLLTSSEKDSESLYKRVKVNTLINIFKNEAVIPAFPDLHLSSTAILKELSTYFPKFSSQTCLLTLPSPHELPPREAQEYPPNRLMF